MSHSNHVCPQNPQDSGHPREHSARRLAKSLEPWRFSIPAGPLLEIGAGSRSFTNYLVKLFPERSVTITDPDRENIAEHRARFKHQSNLEWNVQDAEEETPPEKRYALICGNYAAHTFNNPATALSELCKSLTLDGLLLISFPGEDSFKEWRSTCLDLGIPYTGRPLPGTEPLVIHLSMGPVQVDFYEDQTTIYFDSFRQFLTQTSGGSHNIQRDKRKLTPDEIDLLTNHWKKTKDGKIGVTFHNVFLAAKRIGE